MSAYEAGRMPFPHTAKSSAEHLSIVERLPAHSDLKFEAGLAEPAFPGITQGSCFISPSAKQSLDDSNKSAIVEGIPTPEPTKLYVRYSRTAVKPVFSTALGEPLT